MRATVKAYAGTLEVTKRVTCESVWEAGARGGSARSLVIPAKLAATVGRVGGRRRRATGSRACPRSSRRWPRPGISRWAPRSSRAATSRGWRRCAAGPTSSRRCSRSSSRIPSRRPKRSGCGRGLATAPSACSTTIRTAAALLIERCRPGTASPAKGARSKRSRPGRRSAHASTRSLRRKGFHAAGRAGPVGGRDRRRSSSSDRRPTLASPAEPSRRCAAPPAAPSSVLLHGDLNPTNVLAARARTVARRSTRSRWSATPPTTVLAW